MVAAVILAAGGSRRLGRPKQLVRFEGRSLIRIAVEAAVAAGCRPVVVVLGAESRTVRSALRELDVRTVTNRAWEAGLAGSIRCGLDALRREASDPEAVLLMGCDQPKVSAQLIGELVSVWRERGDPDTLAAACRYAGVLGTPALFAASALERLDSLRGDRGARLLLREDSTRVIALDWPDGAVDIDEPADLTGPACSDPDAEL